MINLRLGRRNVMLSLSLFLLRIVRIRYGAFFAAGEERRIQLLQALALCREQASGALLQCTARNNRSLLT